MTRIHVGDALEVLRGLPAGSVQCCVTSPPYWGLRAYQGDAGMIGLEATFDEHLAALVAVFAEVRRVVREDGCCWINYGDAYSTGTTAKRNPTPADVDVGGWQSRMGDSRVNDPGLKPKDLMMMPARVAMALQADGWWLRSEIVWHKPNPMPESVTDRPTSAHEKLYLLTKSSRYFYDAEAVRVRSETPWHAVGGSYEPGTSSGWKGANGHEQPTANLRNVWSVPTFSFSSAHFATFPPALVEPCIKAGTSERGACASCGAPWRRVVAVTPEYQKWRDSQGFAKDGVDARRSPAVGGRNAYQVPDRVGSVGWEPTCGCGAETRPCVVLDCFGGAGTVGLVADRLQRDAVLIEISAEYAEMARKRIQEDATLLAQVEVVA